MFRWTIELDCITGQDGLKLAVRHWLEKDDLSYPTVVFAARSVVAISIIGKGLVSIVLEDDVCKRWVRICLPVQKFSTLLNVEWIAQGEVSVATMGLFSKTMTTTKFLNNAEILPVDLVYGFQLVKSYMLRNSLTVEPSRT